VPLTESMKSAASALRSWWVISSVSPGVLVVEVVQGRADAVVPLVAGLARQRGRHDLAERVQNHQRLFAVAAVKPGGDGGDHLPVVDAGEVVEPLGDRLALQQPPAAVLEAPVAVLQGEVEDRPGWADLERAEGDAAGGDGERVGEDLPGFADLGGADHEDEALRDQGGHGVGERRELLPVEPGAVTESGEQVGRPGVGGRGGPLRPSYRGCCLDRRCRDLGRSASQWPADACALVLVLALVGSEPLNQGLDPAAVETERLRDLPWLPTLREQVDDMGLQLRRAHAAPLRQVGRRQHRQHRQPHRYASSLAATRRSR
jgi:hypothetical protein